MARKRRSASELEDGLRRLAERNLSDPDQQALLHEVQVYQEELTAQNEALQAAQSDLEETRDRFIDLYDFAPIGYVTLDSNGIIKQLNLTAASWFGLAKGQAEGAPLVVFARPHHRNRVLDFLRQCRASRSGESVTLDVSVQSEEGSVRDVQLVARARGRGEGVEYFTAIIDVTDQRRLEAERARSALARIALARRLISIQEEERQRIARELHDNIGQQLTGLRFKLDAIGEACTDPGVRQRIDEAQLTAEHLDRSLDFIAADLRPGTLDLGFPTALELFAREWSSTFGIPAEVHAVNLDGLRLRPATETHLYRIAQEALNNVYKHAAATRVNVVLERRADRLMLIVEDDGSGFDTRGGSSGDRRGLGLVGMRERANLIDATIEIESEPGGGTTVYVYLPGAFQDR